MRTQCRRSYRRRTRLLLPPRPPRPPCQILNRPRTTLISAFPRLAPAAKQPLLNPRHRLRPIPARHPDLLTTAVLETATLSARHREARGAAAVAAPA